MKKRIGNYFIEFDHQVFALSYIRSTKYWFDVITSLGFSILGLFIVGISVYSLRDIEILIFIFLVFIGLITGITKLIYVISRLLEPSRNIIKYQKNTEIILFNLSKIKHIRFLQEEINTIDYRVKEKLEHGPRNTKRIIWGELWVRPKNQERIQFLTINTAKMIYPGIDRIKIEVLSETKILANYIARELGVEVRKLK